MTENYKLTHDETMSIEEALGKPDGVIAFPTDTVYGLGCQLENEDAVNKIYKLKIRDAGKPLILLGANTKSLLKYVKFIPDKMMELINKYWPGPLTIVLPRTRYVPDYITANLDTVGIRVPDHPVLLELLKRCVNDNVLATTSANLSNYPDLTTYEEVKKVLGDKVDYLVEDYNIPLSGKASTIIALNKDNSIKILRQGILVIE